MTALRRILILSASVGGGHLRTAEAVEAACRIRYADTTALHMDILTLTPAAFRRVYGQLYIDFVNRTPDELGYLYDHTNRAPLAYDLPMVVVNPIPGQETRNATMLFEEGAAISGENPHTIGDRIAHLLESPARLSRMRESAQRLGRTHAARDVAEALGKI